MRVTIVGGGPSGLFLSILLKQRLPHARIDVHEQNPADATFGFGVVLADSGLASLREAAPEVVEDLMGAMRFNDRQTIVMREQPIVVRRPGAGAAPSRASTCCASCRTMPAGWTWMSGTSTGWPTSRRWTPTWWWGRMA